MPGIYRHVPPEREPRGPQLPGPTRPDRISIWPVEVDRFGIDVLFHGAAGFRRAEVIDRQLRDAGVTVSLRQDGVDAWIVRFGPVSRDEMLEVLNGYVW
ncbi:hypothetical protein GKE82_03975 [Conexibacter sp. W3-3-2]|uniref:Uncharacterized protein n=1 Tax=Paraconexibacter algicola TaxID=2133960 RepID=A0A2T4UD40_9ACTN|nr:MULTISPECIES: hypothetical protein [Solirubrobacterales]MTD43480.1 hypothetical protein [Conexibacter sp. W3-3-2]PTL55417.1 hypothetical protein C7Y72_17305 [Paraconexibacter algicola]